MIEITLVGPDGEEVMVGFDEQTREPQRLYVYNDSSLPKDYAEWFNRTWSAELHGYEELNWQTGLNPLFIHVNKPAVAYKWLREKKNFSACSEEEDWIEDGKWPI